MKYTFILEVMLILASLIGGGFLLLFPEEVPKLLLRVIGFTWILEGIAIFLKLLIQD